MITPQTETVEELTTTGDETLFEVHWSPDINGLVKALIDTRAKIFEAIGTAEDRYISPEVAWTVVMDTASLCSKCFQQKFDISSKRC